MAQFTGNIIIRAKIECLTGLHIGAGKDTATIGGVDSPVVRDPRTRQPYIPGSSLKGKMRSMLEFAEGRVKDGKVHNCAQATCPVCRVFGSSAQEERTCGPTRLLVRDAYPDQKTQELWQQVDTELLYTEMKSENFLDRITSAATPRLIERVVQGSAFDLEMVYGVYDVDDEDDLSYFSGVLTGLRLLEDGSLGGNGSRGYGRIRFRFAPPAYLGREDYRTGSDNLVAGRANPDDDVYTLSTSTLTLEGDVVQSWSKASV